MSGPRPLLALALGLAAGCALRPPHTNSSGPSPCTSADECGGGTVCFLGECRGRASFLPPVLVEVRPPNDSPYRVLQQANVDLRSSVIANFTVSGVLVTGTVVQSSDTPGAAPQAVASATVDIQSQDAIIPGRVPDVQVQTDPLGAFSATLPQNGSRAFTIEVTRPSAQPPHPPIRFSQTITQSTPPLSIVLPATSQEVTKSGTVTAGGSPLSGATVIALDANGLALSSSVVAAANGSFSLSLPPLTGDFNLRVSGAPNSTIPAFAPVPIPASQLTASHDFGPLPAVTLSGTVVDAQGIPIGGARVFARSANVAAWTLSTSTTTSASASTLGTYQLPLVAASYLVEAAPSGDATSPSVSQPLPPVAVTQNVTLNITCPPKARETGTVFHPDGTYAGAGTQITATRIADALVSGRVALVAPTDGSGSYPAIGDLGDYLFDFTPPPSSGLPHRRALLSLTSNSTTLPNVRLFSPVEAVGTINNVANGAPVSNATVSFFALDTSAQPAQAVLLGSGVTDAQGHYRATLPDVANPASLTP